jgi:S1-C subfamily serine protease
VWLRIENGPDADRTIEVDEEEFDIGRDPSAEFLIDDPEISRRHASLSPLPDGSVEVNDLGSRNGVYVDGRRIDAPVKLEGGEELRLGDTVLTAWRERPPEKGPAETRQRGQSTVAEPVPSMTPAAASEADQAPRGKSTLQRALLQRDVKRLSWVVVATSLLTLAAVAAVILIATGVFSSDEQSASDVVGSARNSTALVVVDREGKRVGNGSGWVLDAKNGIVVTNGHVIEAGDSFKVAVEGNTRQARVLSVALCDDLALLEVRDTQGLKTMPLGSQTQVKQGDTVFAIGYPGNASAADDLQSYTGSVSVVETTLDEPDPDLPVYPNVIQTDAAINAGSSGGPLIATSKKLVGVSTASGNAAVFENQGYAVGVDRVRELLPELRAGRSIGWGGFGFTAFSEKVRRARGYSNGVLVKSAVKGTEAAARDLTGLFITAINDKPVTDRPAYCRAVSDINSGDTARLRLADSSGQEELTTLRFR